MKRKKKIPTVKVEFEKAEIDNTNKRKLHPAWRFRKIEPGQEGMELGGFEVHFDEALAKTMPEFDHLLPKFDKEESK
jgi:hypothetical protein